MTRRILCITARADHGGGPAHLHTLLCADAPGMEFFVACPREEPYWERFGRCVQDRLFEIPHRRFTITKALELARFVRDNGIELVHSHGKGAGVYARAVSFLTGIPCVHTLHGIHADRRRWLKTACYIAYERLTSRFIDHLIYVSRSEKEVAGTFSLFRNVPDSVIYNGVDIADAGEVQARRQAARCELFGHREPFVVGSLSRFDVQKNMAEALEIAKRSPQLTFLWIGDGVERVALQEKARVEGVENIVFLGFTDRPGYYLAACDAYLSTSRWEGLPLGILEAMSMGLPAVATDVVGNMEAVAHGETGFLYPLSDIELASSLLEKVAGGASLRSALSRSALERCHLLFDKRGMTVATFSVYATVLGEHRSLSLPECPAGAPARITPCLLSRKK